MNKMWFEKFSQNHLKLLCWSYHIYIVIIKDL